jgi:acyl-CoA synthetase (AMP-forming)/AMP-acid ligase II
MLLRQFIANCASNYPRDVAYISGETRRTWGDIHRRTDHLAGALQRLGLRKGDAVGVLAHNCVEIAEHWFACLKGGFVRVGINWRYSRREMLHVLRDSGMKALILDARCADMLTAADLEEFRDRGCALIGFGHSHGAEHDYEALIAKATPFTPPELRGHDLALIGYTSGSTGLPKGVLLTQTNVRESSVHLCIGQGYRFDDVRYYCTNPAGNNIFLACMNILTGMPTVLEDYHADTFLEVVQRHRVTQVTLVPTMLRRAIESAGSGRHDISSLRQITYGTMPTPPALIRQAYEALGCAFLQVYGASESGGPVTALYDVDHRRGLAGQPELLASAGRPLPHARVSVRDDEGRDLPRGEVGNIWLGGKGVMAGYLNMPAETAECLHGEWLRTGDLGHVDERGFIFLGDRRKNMIISGGMNIFPASVENAIAEHPAVSEVIVVGLPHPEWGEAVAAMVCLCPGRSATAEELLAHCRAILPRWEVPKHIEVTKSLPTGFTDKSDKKAVRAQLLASGALPWAAME